MPEIQAAFARRLQKIQTDGVALRQQRQALAMQESQARLDFNALKTGEVTRLEQELAKAPADNAAQQRELIKAKIKELSARRAVSYTHLDVYKRQGQRASFAGLRRKRRDLRLRTG